MVSNDRCSQFRRVCLEVLILLLSRVLTRTAPKSPSVVRCWGRENEGAVSTTFVDILPRGNDQEKLHFPQRRPATCFHYSMVDHFHTRDQLVVLLEVQEYVPLRVASSGKIFLDIVVYTETFVT